MKRTGKTNIEPVLLTFLLFLSLTAWAGCPEGQQAHERTGNCEPIPGWKKADPNKEMIAVVSASPYNFVSLMNNPRAGGAITINAELRFPKDGKESRKIPAMVFVHGSGGPLPRHQKWLRLFREMGIATAYANHFKPRGVRETVGNQTRVTGEMMTADSLYLLNALAEHPRIDPNRIGIMGGSKGGGVAWYVTWNPLREAIAKEKQFAASIPLYPPCIYWEKKDFTDKPMLMMIGDKDDWTGVDQCVSSIQEIQAAGYSNMQVKLYKGAYHGFDSDKGIRQFSKGYDLTKCKLVVQADGRVIEMTSGYGTDTPETKKKMFAGCVSKGVTLGGNHVMPQAMQDVREFLTKALLQ
jgi:dienelactone hydrolase|tara:strand:+ start:999 stop:2057 length:1059 start_codon:yes stop_codon:yes gene_type:complete